MDRLSKILTNNLISHLQLALFFLLFHGFWLSKCYDFVQTSHSATTVSVFFFVFFSLFLFPKKHDFDQISEFFIALMLRETQKVKSHKSSMRKCVISALAYGAKWVLAVMPNNWNIKTWNKCLLGSMRYTCFLACTYFTQNPYGRTDGRTTLF